VPPPDYFDTSSARFPWTPQKCRNLATRRAQLQNNRLFIDDIFRNAGITAEDLYPPQTPNAFQLLLQAIHDSDFDSTKKNSLIYYLLRMWRDGRQIVWAQNKSLPIQYAMVMDGYWAMDEGDIEIEKEFTSKALHAIHHGIPLDEQDPGRQSRLVLRYVRSGKLVIDSLPDMQIYISALCENSLMDAWMYQRTFPEDAQNIEITHGSLVRSKILQMIFDWALTSRGCRLALKDLLTLPLTPFEHSILTTYALHPPNSLSETSLALLQELIHVRLIHQGSFIEAERLERQISVTSSHRSVSDPVRVGLETRRGSMKELLNTLPEIQRKLVELELNREPSYREPSPESTQDELRGQVNGFHTTPTPWRSAGVSPSTAGGMGVGVGAVDLSHSWEDVQRAQSTTSSYSFISQPRTDLSRVHDRNGDMTNSHRSTPVSASDVFRRPASNTSPQKAVLNAFAAASSSNTSIEGAPLSSSRSSSALASALKSPLPGFKRSGPSVPFGIESPIGRSIHAPKTNSARSTASTQILRNSSFLSSASSRAQPQPPLQQQNSHVGLFSYQADQWPRQHVLPLKRSFGQVALSSPQKPDFNKDDTRWDPEYRTHRDTGDMSVSELRVEREVIRNYESGEDDNELVVNNRRMPSEFNSLIPASPPKDTREDIAAPSSSGQSDPKRRKVIPDEDLSDEDMLPGAYRFDHEKMEPSGSSLRRHQEDVDDGDGDVRQTQGQPAKTSRSTRSAVSKTRQRTQTPSPPPQSKRSAKTTATSKRATARPSSTVAAVEEHASEDNSVQPRRSSRLSVAPSTAPPAPATKGAKKSTRASTSVEPTSPGQSAGAKARKGKTAASGSRAKRQPALTIEEEEED
ncbi:hypothetical protein FRB97_003618, partial [Tulasnella sp. 331]